MSGANTSPREVRLAADKRALTVAWDGFEAALEAEYLRVESPSAEVKGHGVGQARLVSGKQSVTIAALEPVGRYALKIVFSDGHQTGLYTWDYLHELAVQREERWARYLADLDAAGLGREVAAPLVPRAGLGV